MDLSLSDDIEKLNNVVEITSSCDHKLYNDRLLYYGSIKEHNVSCKDLTETEKKLTPIRNFGHHVTIITGWLMGEYMVKY